MLLSSILQILDRFQAQPQAQLIEKTEAEPFEKAMASAMEKEFCSKEIDIESAVAELPGLCVPQPAPVVPKQSIEELIRAVTKFEKPEQRVFDMFQ
jgi:hypothetical protein